MRIAIYMKPVLATAINIATKAGLVVLRIFGYVVAVRVVQRARHNCRSSRQLAEHTQICRKPIAMTCADTRVYGNA